MEYLTYDFRHAQEILATRPEWTALDTVIRAVTREEVIETHNAIAEQAGRAPAGGQSAINQVFRTRLIPLGWESEPRLFQETDEGLRRWKMDFIRGRVGVEVSFNHAEAVPWTFTRLNIAGESEKVIEEHRIDVGVALFATEKLKQWARMDSAVGTYELACVWLQMMRPIMPIPILVVGLEPDGWPSTDVFRGTIQRNREKSDLPDD